MTTAATSATVHPLYLDGIREGRASFKRNGMSVADDELANLNATIKGFACSSPVGQLLRGERDFWANQIKRAAIAKATS